ncbi:MAG: hypothetical protein KC646_02815 [Candidatus Cloacimonetes bacterium]|nr:hypothetical protein [Candidatus Cloacimonadota bacterium]
MTVIRNSPLRSKLLEKDYFVDKINSIQLIIDSLDGHEKKSLVAELDPENLREKLQQLSFLAKSKYRKRVGSKDLNYGGYIAVHSLLNEEN